MYDLGFAELTHHGTALHVAVRPSTEMFIVSTSFEISLF